MLKDLLRHKQLLLQYNKSLCRLSVQILDRLVREADTNGKLHQT
jgi:hypothetical protein